MQKAVLIGCVAAMLVLRTVVFGAQTEPAAISIPEISAAPVLDGKLDDAVWQKAATIERLYPSESSQASLDTKIMLARDKHWLYVGVDCRNPLMPQVRQRVFQRGGPVFTDDSILLFIRPDTETKAVYEFDVSFANVQYNKRFSAAGVREDTWSAPWRSATQISADGWTGEIAVPLFALECEDLGRMQINLNRVFMEVKLDVMNAFESDQRVSYALKPNNQGSGFDQENFMAVVGFGGFKPEIPFLPQIRFTRALGYILAGDKPAYGIELSLGSGSSVGGTVELQVLEERGGSLLTVHAERFELRGGAVQAKTLSVPVEDFGERKVFVRLVESGRSANVLAESELDGKSLRVISRVFSGLS